MRYDIQKLGKKNVGITKCDIREYLQVEKVFNAFFPDVVIHFAGLKSVSESFDKALDYYENNVNGSINILKGMEKFSCDKIVFSSSATVYGKPDYLPFDEKHPTKPVSPYGRCKYTTEEIISDWVSCRKERMGVALRYFNPIGCHESGLLERNQGVFQKTCYLILLRVVNGEQDKLNVYGNDYDTPDGTAVRDYVHVVDVAKAHALAIKSSITGFKKYNLGTGQGTSVLEIIQTFENVTKKKIPFGFNKRREGDVDAYWADVSDAKNILRWSHSYSLFEMCEHL